MTLTVTIAGQPVSVLNSTLGITDKVDEQTDFSFVVQDPIGTTTYTKNMQVTLSDDTFGLSYSGYINNRPTATSRYPNPGQNWAIDVRDNTWLMNKRTSKKKYANQFAGPVLVDLIQRYCAAEGLVCNAALDWVELLSEWQNGTTDGTVAAQNASSGNDGDGDLELAPAGSQVTFSQVSQADFNAGTTGGGLSAQSGGGVTFTATQAIKFTASETVPGAGNAYIYHKIWAGSYTIAAQDQISYAIWISSDSPQKMAAVDFVLSDGSTFRDSANNGLDRQGLSMHPKTDLSGVATNTWYSRSFFIDNGGLWTGKTISYISVAFEGDDQGNYTAYFRDIKIFNGVTLKQTFFSTSATSLNASQQIQTNGYANASCTVVKTYERHGYMYSPFFSLAAAGIYKSSFVSWDIDLPTNMTFMISASIDGFATFLPCTNNSPVPGLIPGADLSGKNLIFVYVFDSTNNDPTLTPLLSRVKSDVNPAYICTKSDIQAKYNTSTGWSAGTITGLVQGSGGQLQLIGYARDWTTGDYSSQTLYGQTGIAQGILNQQFTLTCGSHDVRSRLDFAGTWQDFICEVDVTLQTSAAESGIVYRTPLASWQNNNDTYGYAAWISTAQVLLAKGTNSGSGSGVFTLIDAVPISFTSADTYRLKVDVSGNSHQIYIDDVLYINATDATYTAAGYVGLRFTNGSGSSQTGIFDNFGIASVLSGTWVSPTIDLHSLGTISNSQLTLQIDPSVNTSLSTFQAEISLDNGATWMVLTNVSTVAGYYQALPVTGLEPGTNVSGMTQVKIRLTITASTAATGNAMPDLTAVTLWVIGAYSSSGTRISLPLSLDSVGRATNSLISWNANLPLSTGLTVQTSIDNGATWQAATSGGAISGIALTQDAFIDIFGEN